jgi:hypothetical protein
VGPVSTLAEAPPVPSAPRRSRFGPTTVGVLLLAVLFVIVGSSPAVAAQLRLDRRIRTTPFAGSNVSMRDGEGSAYVPGDHSLWLADDNGRAVYEVNAATGALRRTIGRAAFESAPRLGGGPVAGPDRARDFESMAYDRSHDVLYVFSGPCCSASVEPTAFRLRRSSGRFRVESYQPLPDGSNFTAAAWSPSARSLYVGWRGVLRAYRYEANTIGSPVRVPNLSGIQGMGFGSGGDLWVVTSAEQLRRVDWGSKRLVAGWTFDLRRFRIRDSRAVEVIGGRPYVLDGYDGRPADDPLRYAVSVFRIV